MKRFYCAYQCKFPNGKELASTWHFSDSQNLIPALNHFGGTWVESCGGPGKLTVMQLCESKKEAERIASVWNESFRQNGTYAKNSRNSVSMQRSLERDVLHGSKSETNEMKGKVYQMKFYHESDLYTTTDEFPAGYLVWNIGEHHSPRGYIPLCRLKANQPFEGCREIERDSLLALPVSDEIRRVTLRKAMKREIDRKEFEAIIKIVDLSHKSKQH